jgi:hypothetical protein
VITREVLANIPKAIDQVVGQLERYGKFDFRGMGYVRIERWSVNRALEKYKATLLSMKGRLEAEPPSATMIQSARIEWSVEDAPIGKTVRQRHIGRVNPEVIPMIQDWKNAGKPYASSGGLYWTTPNKSYLKIAELSKFPELRDAIRNLGLEAELVRFFEAYSPLRYQVSRNLLDLVISGRDRDALSRHNEMAGTGIVLRNRRLNRSDIPQFAREMEFLLDYQLAMQVAFAATQIADLEPDQVWVINVYDPRVKGAIAARSDMEVMSADFNGEELIIEGVAQTRQAGSDGTGVLANAATEKRIMGSSVSEKAIRAVKAANVEYPFSSRETLIEVWDTDAKPFPNKNYVIGQDLGLTEPVKAGADNLFSRAFTLFSGLKMLSNMISGSGHTGPVYTPFHNFFAGKLQPGEKICAQGDDINAIVRMSTPEIFDPYRKIKSTDPERNVKKILGKYTVMSLKEDPLGEEEAIASTVPRVLKTESSATKRSSKWGDLLSDLEPRGQLELIQPEETVEAIKRDLPVILPYLHWKGKRRDMRPMLEGHFRSIPPEVYAALQRHLEEWEHRLGGTGSPDDEVAAKELE